MRSSDPTIGLLGDVMLGRSVAERLATGDPAELWSPELRELCLACDALVLNLECCISERGAPTRAIPGKPFFFRAPPAATTALAAVGASLAGLANNHALDFGPEALEDTLRWLSEHGIVAVGAGRGQNEARRGCVVKAGAARLGVLAVSDHPTQYAARPGAWGVAHAPLADGLPAWASEELERLRAEADLVLAFPHWGPNMTQRPARWQLDRARELLAAGADLVAGHSAHAFHGVGRVDGRLALYDLGDALDDYAVHPELRNDLGVLALWRPGRRPELELVGLRLHFCHTALAEGADADWIARRLARACAELDTAVERLDEQRFRIAA